MCMSQQPGEGEGGGEGVRRRRGVRKRRRRRRRGGEGGGKGEGVSARVTAGINSYQSTAGCPPQSPVAANAFSLHEREGTL